MSHLIHCDLLLYGQKFSLSVSRLLGDVMGKTQSLDRRQDKMLPFVRHLRQGRNKDSFSI